MIGVARNAKSGAVLVLDGGAVYYLDKLDEWPTAVIGKRVSVTGNLVERKLAPDPVVGPNGEQSAGMYGTSTVIEDPQWEVVK
jgi:hypothetical protein